MRRPTQGLDRISAELAGDKWGGVRVVRVKLWAQPR
jgi:hypothetical protein